MPFLPLKDLLPKAIRTAGSSDQVQAAVVLETFQRVLDDAAPPRVASQAKAVRLQDGHLTVQVASSVIAQELKGREAEILSQVNAKSPLPVERLRFEFYSP